MNAEFSRDLREGRPLHQRLHGGGEAFRDDSEGRSPTEILCEPLGHSTRQILLVRFGGSILEEEDRDRYLSADQDIDRRLRTLFLLPSVLGRPNRVDQSDDRDGEADDEGRNDETGRWFLIGSDGYSTSKEEWDTRGEAEQAAEEDSDDLTWEY